MQHSRAAETEWMEYTENKRRGTKQNRQEKNSKPVNQGRFDTARPGVVYSTPPQTWEQVEASPLLHSP